MSKEIRINTNNNIKIPIIESDNDDEKLISELLEDYTFKEENQNDKKINHDSIKSNIILGKKIYREISEDENKKAKDINICIICKENKGINLKDKYNDLYECNKCKRLFHLDCLQLIDNETNKKIISKCSLCLSLIENNFDNFKKYCHKVKHINYNNNNDVHKKLNINLNKTNVLQINEDSSSENNLIKGFIEDFKNKNNELDEIYELDTPLLNSKICMNIEYGNIKSIENECNIFNENSYISYPFLFSIPNEFLYENTTSSNQLNKDIYNIQIIKDMSSLLIKKDFVTKNHREIINEKSEETLKKNGNESVNEIEIKNFIKSEDCIKILTVNQNIVKNHFIIRKYWKLISTNYIENFNQNIIKYLIEDKELLYFPDMYNSRKSKLYLSINNPYTIGDMYSYFNGKLFAKIINIYDFLNTFSSKIYLSQFSLEEFYSSLKLSEKNKNKEILLISSIHISLCFLLINELHSIPINDINTHGDYDLLLIKIIIDSYYFENNTNELFLFINYSWPELIRIIFSCKTFNKNFYLYEEIDKNMMNKLITIKNINSYNYIFSFEEKIIILERLIKLCYEIPFIKTQIKEIQDRKLGLIKKQREFEEELKNIELKRREVKKKEKRMNPKKKIEEISQKIKELKTNSEQLSDSHTKEDIIKMLKKIEKYKIFIKKRNNINDIKNELEAKIELIKLELFNIYLINKKYLGIDRYGIKYYFINEKLFAKVKNKEKNGNEYKYEWRIISNEKTINELIFNLCDKGIHENDLKIKLQKISDFKANISFINSSLEDIFINNVLKYDNYNSPLNNVQYSNYNEFEIFFNKICKIENDFSNYLMQGNKEWENDENKLKIKSWIINAKDIKKYTNLLLFLNDKFKSPYKINKEFIQFNKSMKNINNTINDKNGKSIYQIENNNLNINSINSNEKIHSKNIIFNSTNASNILNNFYNIKNLNNADIEEKKEIFLENGNIPSLNKKEYSSINHKNLNINIDSDNELFDKNGDINLDYKNSKVQTLNYKTKLWSKEFISYNLEYLFIKYVNNIQSFSGLYVSITIFQIILHRLIKRREICRKKIILDNKKKNKSKNRYIKKKNYEEEEEEKIEIDNDSEIREEYLIKIDDEENDKIKEIKEKKKYIFYI